MSVNKTTEKVVKDCHCGSQIKFNECCEPFLSGELLPSTAEKLMRARYSAFCMGNVDYIVNSHHPDTRNEIDAKEVKDWALNAKWNSLEVLNIQKGQAGDEAGIVEFVANYDWQGAPQKHHEVAHFKIEDGTWFFVDGQLVKQTLRRSTPKVGRNDPCPCESGKKFKKCCGA